MKKLFVALLYVLFVSSYGQGADSTFVSKGVRFADLQERYIDKEADCQCVFAFQDTIKGFYEQNGLTLLGHKAEGRFRNAHQIRRVVGKSFRGHSLFPLMEANNKFKLVSKRELQGMGVGKSPYDFSLIEEFLNEFVTLNCQRIKVKWVYEGKRFKTWAFSDDDAGLFYDNIIAGRLLVGILTEHKEGERKVSFPIQKY